MPHSRRVNTRPIRSATRVDAWHCSSRPATRYDSSRRNSHFGRFASSRQHNWLCDKMFGSTGARRPKRTFPRQAWERVLAARVRRILNGPEPFFLAQRLLFMTVAERRQIMKIDGIRRDSSNIAKKAWYAESRRRRFALFLLHKNRLKNSCPISPRPAGERVG